MRESFSLFRLLLGLAFPLVIVGSAMLLLIGARRYDGSTVAAFFAESCEAMPCWQGIRPGTTTINQALAILSSHPWIADISEVNTSSNLNTSGTVLIYWRWSARYPFIDGVRTSHQPGILVTDQGLVRQIYLTTSIPLGDLWLALGGAQERTLNAQVDQQRLRIDNTALFVNDGIAATATLYGDCLTEPVGFWQTPVFLWLRDTLPPPDVAPLNLQYQQVRALFC
jgi:hypothetical protein